jgi:hypothetical protein
MVGSEGFETNFAQPEFRAKRWMEQVIGIFGVLVTVFAMAARFDGILRSEGGVAPT